MNYGGKYITALALVLALFASACGSDSESATDAEDDAGTESEESGSEQQNACPAEGCQIDFGTVAKSGDEIEVTWEINFQPDLNNNHVHIYWDNFTANQVSNDATDRGVDQGEWVPTDLTPSYVTEGAASTAVRGESTTLCLVAADRDHNVIDDGAEVCMDVSEFL